MRARCPNCGADVDHATDTETGEDVVLDLAPEGAGTHADRWRIVGHNPLRARRVVVGAPGRYLPEHRFDCPAHSAGLPDGRR